MNAIWWIPELEIYLLSERFACFRPQHPSFSEQISRMSCARRWFSHPRGPRLRGCLERFACFGGQHLLLSEQTLRMSRARRWFSHARGLRLRRCLERFACFGGQTRRVQALVFVSRGLRFRGCLERFACFGGQTRGRGSSPGRSRRLQ